MWFRPQRYRICLFSGIQFRISMALKWHLAQKLEVWWWKKYLSRQEPTAYLKNKERYWQKILKLAEMQPEEGARVLDAGCGPAGVFTVLKKNRVDAVDPLVDEYEAKLAIFSRINYPWVRFFTHKLESFVSPDLYATVFCFNAINHVEDIQKGFDALSAVLAPGGALVLSVDTHRYKVLKWLFRILPGDALHPHQYDREEYVRFLEQRGFRIVREELLRRELIFDYRLWVARRGPDPMMQ